MEFIDRLREEFPLMYTHGDIYVGEGWQPIIFALSSCIQSHIDSRNSHNQYLRTRGANGINIDDLYDVPQVEVAQIKEKFGGLRFYYDGGDDYTDGLVQMAESWASKTCELCGKSGQYRNLPWIKTLCDEHYEEAKARYETRKVPNVGSTPDTEAV
jgi:hypothetical protein